MAPPAAGPSPVPATSSRPPVSRVREAVEASLREQGLEGARLLVAVSGGVDSTVLLDALHGLQARCPGLRLAVGHVHHGLRGEAADGDAAAVEAAARARGLPFGCARVDPRRRVAEALSSRSRPTLQEAARRLRYEALWPMARQLLAAGPGNPDDPPLVATAHTASDQAETVLLRLLRGCGPSGLSGIPPRSADGRVVRPLLSVDRATVEAYARARGLAWRDDASNGDRHYARNRLRHDWLPALAREFNPQLLNTLAHLAESHRRDADWIDALVAAEASRRFRPEPPGLAVEASGWAELAPALAWRLLRRAWVELSGGRDLGRHHLERLHAFALAGRPGRLLELPGGLRARFADGRLRLWVEPPTAGAPAAGQAPGGSGGEWKGRC